MGQKLSAESWVAKGGSRMARGHGSWEPWQMRREEGSGYCVSSWQGTGMCIFAGGIKRFGNCREKGLVMCLEGKKETLAQDRRVKGVSAAKETEGMYEGAWVWGRLMWLGKKHLQSGACKGKAGAVSSGVFAIWIGGGKGEGEINRHS